MSAFLGPIHHWLYNKIEKQEALTNAILLAIEDEESRNSLAALLDSECGKGDCPPLVEVINTGNIHAWLQERIGIAERRFALLNTCILQSAPELLPALCAIAEDNGRTMAFSNVNNAMEAYKALNDSLLDGMPCDRVNLPVEQGEDVMVYRQSMDLHAPFWEERSGDVSVYHQIRSAWVRGMLADSGFTLKQNGNQFTIERIA